jgi:outer membrane immunogenic protein
LETILSLPYGGVREKVMKKWLLGGASLVALGLGFGANAADLPAYAPAYKAPPLMWNWTGFYVGGTVGGAWGTFDPTTSTVFNPAGYPVFAGVPANVGVLNAMGLQSLKPSGFTGGAEAGYNWQAGNIVFGVEADIESFRLGGNAVGTAAIAGVAPPSTFTLVSTANSSWLFTARPRVGIANNNWLFYATGGLAVTNLSAMFTFTDNFFGSTESGIISNTRVGYTVGGGIEAGLWDRWTVKAEYLYVNFGTISTTSTNLNAAGVAFPTQPFTHSIDLKAGVARAGLNYRF